MTSSFFKILFAIIWIFSSCSSLDTNQVKKSTQYVKGGKAKNSEWKEALIFKRTSWYYQASLLYEINIAQVPLDSGFMHWFDAGEASSIKNCKQLLWVVDYAYDSRRVQPNYVKDLLSIKGFIDIAVPTFEKNFINHPDTAQLSNRNYKMRLFCHESATYSSITATLPGYKEEVIEF